MSKEIVEYNEILWEEEREIFSITWVNHIMLNETSQTQKGKYRVSPSQKGQVQASSVMTEIVTVVTLGTEVYIE